MGLPLANPWLCLLRRGSHSCPVHLGILMSTALLLPQPRGHQKLSRPPDPAPRLSPWLAPSLAPTCSVGRLAHAPATPWFTLSVCLSHGLSFLTEAPGSHPRPRVQGAWHLGYFLNEGTKQEHSAWVIQWESGRERAETIVLWRQAEVGTVPSLVGVRGTSSMQQSPQTLPEHPTATHWLGRSGSGLRCLLLLQRSVTIT